MRVRRSLAARVVITLATLLVTSVAQADICPEGYPEACDTYCCPAGSECDTEFVCKNICPATHPVSCDDGTCCPEGATCSYGVCEGACAEGYGVKCGDYCCPDGSACDDSVGFGCQVPSEVAISGSCFGEATQYCYGDLCCPSDAGCGDSMCWVSGVGKGSAAQSAETAHGVPVVTAVELYREEPSCAIERGSRGAGLAAALMGLVGAAALARRRARRYASHPTHTPR